MSAGWVANSHPATRAVPPLRGGNVATMRSVVVLPAPLGPRKPKISPWRTFRSTPATASTVRLRALNTRRRPRVSMTASVWLIPIPGDSAGRRLLTAGEQRPEGFERGSAAAVPADRGDRPQHRCYRQACQQSRGDIGRHRALGEGGEDNNGD